MSRYDALWPEGLLVGGSQSRLAELRMRVRWQERTASRVLRASRLGAIPVSIGSPH